MTDHRAYSRAVTALTLSLLLMWFAVSFGAGILFREALDAYNVGGAPLGFWMAQQGSIYVFVALIFIYHAAMKRVARKYLDQSK